MDINIVSLSGGKDSTAMLFMMLDRGEEIHSAVFFDTGWEFPPMNEHIDLIEKMVDFPVVRLKPEKSFDYWLHERRVVVKKGQLKGQVARIGNGWPSPMRRWCTRQKVYAMEKYFKKCGGPSKVVTNIGYAKDEIKRCKDNTRYSKRYPLIEYGITEAEALFYCKTLGFHWGGLYEVFNRVSCFCCPLQRISELRKLRKFYPDLWSRMLTMDASIKKNRGFKGYKTVHDFEKRFREEDRQLLLFENFEMVG